MKRFFFFIILIYCSIVALGQSFTLKGRVLDGNMSPIELATVSVLQQGKVTMTNLKGEFSIQLHSADSVVVSFSMVGYKTKKRILRNPRGKQNLQIILSLQNGKSRRYWILKAMRNKMLFLWHGEYLVCFGGVTMYIH